jgi:FixJ family two-component response regulator
MSDLELKIIKKILEDENAMEKALAFILQDQGSAPKHFVDQQACLELPR